MGSKWNKKVLGVILLCVALAIVGWILFSNYSSSTTTAWRAVPENAAIVVEVNDILKLTEKITSQNEIWQGLVSNSKFQGYHHGFVTIDSLIRVLDKNNNLTSHLPLLLSFHANQENDIHLLGVINVPEKIIFERLIALLEESFDSHPFGKIKNAVRLIGKDSDRQLILGYNKGLLIFSQDSLLFNNSLSSSNSKSKHFSENVDFQKLYQTSGSNVDAHVFLNYRHIGSMLKNYSNHNYAAALQWLGSFASWSEVDLMLKQNEILMTGFTTIDSSGNQFLDHLQTQETIEHKAINIIPFNSNMLLSFGIPKNYSPSGAKIIEEKLKLDPGEFFSMLKGEVALASNANQKSADNHWFMARVNNKDEMDQFLRKLSRRTGGKTAQSGKFLFRKINHDNLIPGLFGNCFSVINKSWYFFIEDFVVFGNSPQSLTNFARYFETGKTLDLNEGFEAVSDNISGSSNLLLLIRPHDFEYRLDSYLNQPTIENLEQYSKTVKNIQGIAVQYSNSDPFIYTSFYLLNNSDYQEENLAVWKTELDGKISQKTFLVKDHKTGMFNVLAFDDDANMYLISTDGKILWKKRIDALTESPIFQVDYYKNRKIQYLFNTRDFIYLFDKNGNNVDNYPKKLNPSATNGLNLFDYEKKKDYRLLVAQSDKRIYNYTLKGKQVKGWSKPKSTNIVSDPVTRLVSGNKDYFIINDLDNNIKILNRKGNQRIKLKQNPKKAKNSAFYINKTNSKGIIITTNEQGKLTYINKNGKLEYTDFGDFSPIHFFLYEDFNGDGSRDFIYVDGSELKVFDRFKNVLFAYSFESTISIRPEFFSLGRNQKVLGIVADQERAVYLFDKKGNTIISRGLISETAFTVGSLENGNEINLLTAAGRILYNYRLK